jgi:hypothetical protein
MGTRRAVVAVTMVVRFIVGVTASVSVLVAFVFWDFGVTFRVVGLGRSVLVVDGCRDASRYCFDLGRIAPEDA